MELKEMQDKSNEIVEKIDKLYKGKNHDAELTFVHVVEEIGEIARQIYNDKHKRVELDNNNLAEEIAEGYILLARLATIYNINIEKAIRDKIDNLKQRHNID